jgi:hypothetical protein
MLKLCRCLLNVPKTFLIFQILFEISFNNGICHILVHVSCNCAGIAGGIEDFHSLFETLKVYESMQNELNDIRTLKSLRYVSFLTSFNTSRSDKRQSSDDFRESETTGRGLSGRHSRLTFATVEKERS